MKNKSLSIRLVAVLSAAMLGAGLAAGCGNGNTVVQESDNTQTETTDEDEAEVVTDNDSTGSDSSTASGTNRQEENDPNFNHGHSISETSPGRPNEIQRSYEVVVHDSNEALEYLEHCVSSKGSEFTYELTDTSDDDPGAYMWYRFNLSYYGEVIDGAEFTVLAFTDGTIVEGWHPALSNTVEDKANAQDPDDILQLYINSSGDNRKYVYQNSGYLSTGKSDTVFRYVYTYRYDCGDVLENITLKLDAITGEMVGYQPDAIS